MSKPLLKPSALAVWLLSANLLLAQQHDDTPTPLVHAQSRLVIEDVSVTDARGNPVHGLPASAFHVLDNGTPQRLIDFDEGSPAVAQAVPGLLPIGTFTKAIPQGQPPTTEILLIDADSMKLTDQMFLLKQLQASIKKMPADLPVSMFAAHNGRAVPVLSPTTDRSAMTRAVEDILPVQNHAIDSHFESAVNQLLTIAAFLQQTHGRKNLLWFSGDYPLVSIAVGEEVSGGLRVNFSARENVIHQVQEALAESRISVYPIDVRGVLTDSLLIDNAVAGALQGDRSPRAASAASQRKEVDGPEGAGPVEQRSEMRSLAQATGGRAYMLNNLSAEIGQAFELGKSAYTLTYAPSPYRTDQSFHTIRIWVDGNYTLSYRTGYLATFTGEDSAPERKRLTPAGPKEIDPEQNKVLTFQVHLDAQPDPEHFTETFSIPLAELKEEHTGGIWSSRLLLTTYAYDTTGKVLDGKMQELDTDLSEQQYRQACEGHQRIAAEQQLTVPKHAKYLIVIARDRNSQRTGSLMLQTRLLGALPMRRTSTSRLNTP